MLIKYTGKYVKIYFIIKITISTLEKRGMEATFYSFDRKQKINNIPDFDHICYEVSGTILHLSLLIFLLV